MFKYSKEDIKMSVIDAIKVKAKADKKHILLPEGTEPRTVQAAAKITAEGIAKVTLLGSLADGFKNIFIHNKTSKIS